MITDQASPSRPRKKTCCRWSRERSRGGAGTRMEDFSKVPAAGSIGKSESSEQAGATQSEIPL